MLLDIIGWLGMILVLVAYGLLSLGKIKNGYLYQLLNLLASVLMGVALLPKNAWFSFALEIAWGAIAIAAIIKLKTKKHKK